MRRISARLSGRVLSVLAAVVAATSLAAANPISMERRDVLFSVGSDAWVTGSAALSRVRADAGPFEVELFLTGEQAKEPYALQVAPGVLVMPDDDSEPVFRVLINGDTLDIVPLERTDGALFYVPAPYLVEGCNVLRIEPAAPVASQAWTDTRMFSLDGTGEQVHFDLAFADPKAAVRAAPATDPLQAKYDVQWYDCTWAPTMTARSLQESSAWMGAKSLDSTLQTVVLDFDNNGGSMTILGVDSGPSTAALPYTYSSTTKMIRITLPAPVPAGREFRVRVRFQGTPATRTLFGNPFARTTHGSPSRSVVYTFSQPYGARTWWPCKDQTHDKATTMTLRVSVPSGQGWEVVTNGLLQSRTISAGRETWEWFHAYPISTYLVSICITNYIYVGSTYTALDGVTTMPIAHAIYPENISFEATGAQGTLAVMNFFAQIFGEYPFLTEKYFTASHASGSGMEHQTCTSMPARDVQDGRQRRNVHELAHMWFGDLITCESFEHLWLNEGFATLAEALWVEHNSGRQAYHDYVNNWTVTTSQPVVGPNTDNFATSVAYRKGAWILHMLRGMVGEAKFFEILRGWAAHPTVRYGTANSQQFEDFCESVTVRDLTAFFSQWLYRGSDVGTPAQPAYRFNASLTRGAPNTLSLRIDQTQGGAAFVMPIPIRLKDAAGATLGIVAQNTQIGETITVGVGTFDPVELDFDPDNWVLKTPQISINTCGLPRAQRNAPYTRTLRASYTPVPVPDPGPYTWSVTAGSLPPGITLSSAGVLSGTPTTAGLYTFTVQARDAGANTRTTQLSLDVFVSGVEDWLSLQ